MAKTDYDMERVRAGLAGCCVIIAGVLAFVFVATAPIIAILVAVRLLFF